MPFFAPMLTFVVGILLVTFLVEVVGLGLWANFLGGILVGTATFAVSEWANERDR